MDDLQKKVIADGEAEKKLYEKFTEWCEDETTSNGYALKDAKAKAESLAASIEKEGASIQSLTATIEELAATIARNEKDLAAATSIREKENADFKAADAELADTVDQVSRALSILSRELKGASFAQGAQAVTDALSVVLQAAMVENDDKSKLQSLLQSSDEDDFLTRGAPVPEAYKSHSGAIIDTLEDMKDKAKALRHDGQTAEMNAQHSYEMLRQSLETALAQDNKDLDEAKASKSASEEAKAGFEGDLSQTQKTIAETEKYLQEVNTDCQERAADNEASTKSREEELSALAEAKKVLEKASGAESRTYGLMQLKAQDSVDFAPISQLLKSLSKKTGDVMLSQLSNRVSATVAMGDDVFAKVKAMIEDLLSKLIQEAQEEADHKAWCDKEMSETKAKIDDHTETIEKLTIRIDKAESTIAALTADIARFEKELGEGAKLQAEMDATRVDEKNAFKAAKKDYEEGIEGLTMALKVLRDYYAENAALVQQPETVVHSKSGDAATGIIGLLEVVQSDFSKTLANLQVDEDTAQSEYEKISQENAVTKAMREADLKYAKKAKASTEAALSDSTNDRASEQAELDAVLEYSGKLAPACIEKPMTYEERKERRESEIAGLKEALSILSAEAPESFLSVRSRR